MCHCSCLSPLQEEQQKTKKKKKSTKKKPMAIEEPLKHSQDNSSSEPNLDSESNAADHEYSTGPGKPVTGQPMAPGVFLNQKRPSVSSPNNNSAQPAKVERGNSADAKGVSPKFKLSQTSVS